MTVFTPWYVAPEYWEIGYADGDGFYQLNAELQQAAPSAVIELFELELNTTDHGVSETYRFHAGTNLNANGSLVWDGNTYLRFPVEAGGFEYNGQGQLPRPKIRVSNIFGTITAILLGLPSGLERAKVTRIRTLARFLDAVNFPGGVNPYGTPDATAEFPREIYYVDRKAIENRDVVEFELAAAFDLTGVRAPKRQCISSICQWRYRSAECGYVGTSYFDANDNPVATLAEDVCGKRLSSCEARFSTLIKNAIVTYSLNTLSMAGSATSGIEVGDPVRGFGVPNNTTVTSVSTSSVGLSNTATASSSATKTGTPSATEATMTVVSATLLGVGMTVTGPYIDGSTVTGISGNTITLNRRPFSFARVGTFVVDGAGARINIDTTGITAGMRVFGSHGIDSTVGTAGATSITIAGGYGDLATDAAISIEVSLYFMEASPSAASYSFAASTTYSFRNADAGLPFGSFPGVGTYLS